MTQTHFFVERVDISAEVDSELHQFAIRTILSPELFSRKYRTALFDLCVEKAKACGCPEPQQQAWANEIFLRINHHRSNLIAFGCGQAGQA